MALNETDHIINTGVSLDVRENDEGGRSYHITADFAIAIDPGSAEFTRDVNRVVHRLLTRRFDKELREALDL